MNRAWMALSLLSGCIRIETVVEAESASTPPVVFDVPIPNAPQTLSVYPLQPAPVDRMLLDKLGRQAEACRSLEGKLQVYDDKPGSDVRKHCRIDEASGDIEVYPDFKQLSTPMIGAPIDRKHALELTREVIEGPRMLAKDPTLGTVHLQYVLKHERAERNAPPGPGAPRAPSAIAGEAMLFTTVKRQVHGLDVDGPGSRLLVASDDNGVQGFVRSWRTAGEAREVKASRTATEVRAEIERQLLAMKPHATLHVRKIELSYYDGNATLLQPVYRFVVEVSPSRHSLGAPEHFVGYVRYAETEEKVPELGVLVPEKSGVTADAAKRSLPQQPPIQLGAYIARDRNPDWLNDARAFMGEIKASAPEDAFAVKQFLSAFPIQFTSASQKYVNSVDIALVEAHGAAWKFATLGDCCEPVQFGKPASTGFGPGVDQGRLQHLVLHSCNVVASPDETPRWAEAWWDVFKGLRSVVGYRTAMYINDGAGAAFGRSLGAGSAVLPAWFNAVASLNAYGRDPSLGFRCDGEQAMGRPAAISVCGEEDAASVSVSHATDPATCLDAWWISDATNLY